MARSRHIVVSYHSGCGLLRLKSTTRTGHSRLLGAVLFIFMLATLACALVEPTTHSKPLHIRRLAHLPTRTPTALAVALPAPTLISPNQMVALPTEPVIPTVVPPIEAPSSNEPAVSIEEESSAGSTLTVLVNLNVRTGPSVDYSIVGKLNQGELAQITGKNPEGTWWQIIYPPGSGSLAWVIADVQYSTVGNTGGVPVVQLPSPPGTPPSAPPSPTDQAPPSAGLPGSPTPVPPPTVISGPAGWAFAGVQLYPNQDDGGLILYGNAINNTGGPQELLSVTGIFYDGQGQMIADASKTYAYWPSYVVPAGGSMPFELIVDDIDTAARYDLRVEAEPNSESPRQDFELAEVNQWTEDDTYCVEGVVHNSGSPLAEYLVVAAVLYDSQNNLVNFSDSGELGLETGSDNAPFEICVNLSNQQVARHELQAWGQ